MDMQRIYVINQECSDDFQCSLWTPRIASFLGDKISTYVVFIVNLKDKTDVCICIKTADFETARSTHILSSFQRLIYLCFVILPSFP